MPITRNNCMICGTPLFKVNIAKKEWFCPNHGVITENQDWNDLELKKSKKEKKKND